MPGIRYQGPVIRIVAAREGPAWETGGYERYEERPRVWRADSRDGTVEALLVGSGRYLRNTVRSQGVSYGSPLCSAARAR
jgi:hypothetical protein